MNYTATRLEKHYQIIGENYMQLFNEERHMIKEASELRKLGAEIVFTGFESEKRLDLEKMLDKRGTD